MEINEGALLAIGNKADQAIKQLNQINKTLRSDIPVEQRIKSVISKQLEISDVQLIPMARFREDLGADSLELVYITSNLEEEFSIKISDKKAKDFHTVGDVMSYITGKNFHS